jgi:integrase
MAGVKSKPTKGGLYQAWFVDYTGKKKYFTMRSKADAQRKAQRLEDEHQEIRKGLRPPPDSSARHRKRPCSEVMTEYLAWGEAQGGRGGRPWGKTHARMRRSHLEWWQECLGLETLSDLYGMLPRAEKELRGLQRKGRAGKTIANYAEALGAFCDWCKQRGYLAEDPLEGLAAFDTTPQTHRRAMTIEEMTCLLNACPVHRRLLYETAFNSGLRANELRNLSVGDLDTERGGLHLDAAWTKNRKPGFQRLPEWLVERLTIFAESGEARRQYKLSYARKDTRLDMPKNPLLYVPSNTSRAFDKDLENAKLPKHAPGGKLDFHACRTAYINLVIDSGVTVKEAQELARHSTPELTMNIYGRANEERLAAAVERVGEALKPTEGVPGEYRQAVGAETESATLIKTEGCASQKWWRRRDSNPRPKVVPSRLLRA